MAVKRLATFVLGLIGVSLVCTGCFLKTEKATNTKDGANVNTVQNQTANVSLKKEAKYDLYANSLYDIPLVSIVEISKLPVDTKKVVDNLLEQAQGFYYLKIYDDKIFVILQNPVSNINSYSRHNLEFAEISFDGKVTYHSAGYAGIDGETANAVEQSNDLWEFDETVEPFRPKKHVMYDEKGKIKFTELWNYDDTEAVKYQMKNSHKKVISIYKESQDDDSNLRKEHIFYDNEGNTKMSLIVNYEGPNISRLTFYNSHDTIDSFSIISEYSDGLKVKELIYNEDYALEKTIVSDYIDATRKSIRVINPEEEIITEIKS